MRVGKIGDGTEENPIRPDLPPGITFTVVDEGYNWFEVKLSPEDRIDILEEQLLGGDTTSQ